MFVVTACDAGIGISGDKLTREKAAELIATTRVPADFEYDLPDDGNVFGVGQCLSRAGAISNMRNGNVSGTYITSNEAGSTLSKLLRHSFGGLRGVTFASPVYYADVVVTGIVSDLPDDSKADKDVEFEAGINFPEISSDNPIRNCIPTATSSRQTRIAKARYFDDGWRIEFQPETSGRLSF